MESPTEVNYWAAKVIKDFEIPPEKISEIEAFCRDVESFNFERLYNYLDLTRFFANHLGRNEWPMWCFIAFAGTEVLAKKIPDFGTLRHNGMNALHFAVVGVNSRVQDYCIKELGVSPASCDDEGSNVAHFAAWVGSYLTCDSLCLIYNLDPFAKNKNGMTLFDIAIQQKHIYFLKYYICDTDLDLSGFVESLYSFIITRKDLKLIKMFLEKYARYLQRNPLHVEIEKGDLESIVFAIEELGLDPTAKNNEGENALHIAATVDKSGYVIAMLLGFYGVDPTTKNNDGVTPLEYAQKAGNEAGVALLSNTEKCSKLIENSQWKKRVIVDFKLVNRKISDITQESAAFKHVFDFQQLHKRLSSSVVSRCLFPFRNPPVWVFFMLSGVFDDKFSNLEKRFGELTSLHIAVLLGNLSLVKKLSAAGVSHGVLEFAIKGGNLGVTKYLIEECGVEPNSLSLMTAAEWDRTDIAIYFISTHNIDPRALDNFAGEMNNLLHTASKRGNVVLMKYLMSDEPLCKIDPTEENRQGCNALHLAAKYDNEAAVKMLVGQYGMDATVKTGYPSLFKERYTPLELATKNEWWGTQESVDACCALLDDTKKCRGLVAEYGLRQIYKLLISDEVENPDEFLSDLENFFNALNLGIERKTIGFSLFNPVYTYRYYVEKCDALLAKDTSAEAREYFKQAAELFIQEKCQDEAAADSQNKLCFRLKEIIKAIAAQPLEEFLAESQKASAKTAPRSAFYGPVKPVSSSGNSNFDYENLRDGESENIFQL
ncbi:MAG: ankyrin repeat domain-containing protein [Gammaproteobacteria bacterium]|nr:ankyrin repeat domain-containing protein [Gammaproteobacteria bacterium]